MPVLVEETAGKRFMTNVLAALNDACNHIADDIINKAKEELENRVRQEVARISIAIASEVSFKDMGATLQIDVRFRKNKEEGAP